MPFSLQSLNSKRLRQLSLAVTIAYPIVLHLTLIQGLGQRGVALLLIVSSLHAAVSLLLQHYRNAIVPSGVALLAITSLVYGNHYALYLPPLLIYGLLLWLFGRTLLPGREAFISRMARIVFDDQSIETSDYTHKITWLWSLFFLTMLLVSLYLTLFASLEHWSLFTNIINYLLLVVLALLEYSYRLWRFRRWPSWQSVRRLTDRTRLAEWLRGTAIRWL